MSGIDPETYCRQMLDPERFEDVLAQMVALPPGVDRDAVFEALTNGVLQHDAHHVLAPDAVRDLEDALDGVRRTIGKLEKILRQAPTGLIGRQEVVPSYLKESPAEDLRRELATLESKYALWLQRDDVGFLNDDKPRNKEGRPRATWRTVTEARLRKAGVPPLMAEALVEAAGLVGPTPRGKTPEKT